MKYKDKNTIRSHINHVSKLEAGETKSDRKIRREKERRLNKFTLNVYKYIDRDWWDSVDFDVKEEIYSNWIVTNIRSRSDISFEVWIKSVRKDIKPNKQVYREKIIDNILDDE